MCLVNEASAGLETRAEVPTQLEILCINNERGEANPGESRAKDRHKGLRFPQVPDDIEPNYKGLCVNEKDRAKAKDDETMGRKACIGPQAEVGASTLNQALALTKNSNSVLHLEAAGIQSQVP